MGIILSHNFGNVVLIKFDFPSEYTVLLFLGCYHLCLKLVYCQVSNPHHPEVLSQSNTY